MPRLTRHQLRADMGGMTHQKWPTPERRCKLVEAACGFFYPLPALHFRSLAPPPRRLSSVQSAALYQSATVCGWSRACLEHISGPLRTRLGSCLSTASVSPLPLFAVTTEPVALNGIIELWVSRYCRRCRPRSGTSAVHVAGRASRGSSSTRNGRCRE